MNPMLLIFVCIALTSVTALCITLAIVAVQSKKNVDRITTTLEQVGNDVSDLRTQVSPLIHEVSGMLKKTDKALSVIDESLQQIRRGTAAFEGMANDVRELERDLINKVRSPLDDIGSFAAKTISKITRLLRTIVDR